MTQQQQRPTCAELVELVKARGPKALTRMRWLDELADIDRAAEFTGLDRMGVRSYHQRAKAARAALNGAPETKWLWPKPDLLVAGHPAWKLRSLVLARASMPGRGAGGGRPWPKRESSLSS